MFVDIEMSTTQASAISMQEYRHPVKETSSRYLSRKFPLEMYEINTAIE